MRFSAALRLISGHLPPSLGKPAEEQVFGDRKILEQIEFLMNEGDAVGARVARASRDIIAAVQAHRPAIARKHAAEDVHRGGFARAVLADEAKRLAGTQA